MQQSPFNQSFGPPYYPFQYPRAVYSPSSYSALPELSFPSPHQIAQVEKIRGSLIQNFGIKPGTYSTIDPGMYDPIEGVFNGLMDTLLSELSGVDAFDLCIRLYRLNEEYLGHIYKTHFERATRQSVFGVAEPPMLSQKLWIRLSPYTESLRWLIEIAIKFCDTGGVRLSAGKFDRLVELARATFEWDLTWEHVHHKVIPHEVNVSSDYGVTSQPTPRAERMMRAHSIALAPNTTDWEQENFERYQARKKVTIQQTIDVITEMGLDPGLTQEYGYTMSDWTKFTSGLIDSFAEDEYLKVNTLARLEAFLAGKWNLDPQKLTHLLRDFGLSNETVGDVDIQRLRPVEYGRRKSRLIRRPVVVLEQGGATRCIYGLETIEKGTFLILQRLESGRIDLVNQSSNKALRSAVGKQQKDLGSVLERNIADECRALGYQCQREKNRIKSIRMPEGKNFGPVDVFLVDHNHRRFVLVEAKNVADEGTMPREMANEKRNFAGYISKLNSQVQWYTQHLEDLQTEYEVNASETYSVEGVILVSRPRIWMYTYDEPVSILDYLQFFRRLAQGRTFIINPVEST